MLQKLKKNKLRILRCAFTGEKYRCAVLRCAFGIMLFVPTSSYWCIKVTLETPDSIDL